MRYLTLTYFRRASGQIDETMAVTRRLKDRDITTSNVILDFRDQRVIKCTMDGTTVPKDWDRIVSYYYKHYSATIERLFLENGHATPQEPVVADDTVETPAAETAQSA
jgi:hypothetical protein